MSKTFEDYFSEIQADMVSICSEYVENRAEKIFIYCSYEAKVLSCDFFYCINEIIVERNKINEVCSFEYDVSIERQLDTIEILEENTLNIVELCKKYEHPMPTEIKLVYDVKKNSLNADYKYDLVYTNIPKKTADDIVGEWFEEVKDNNLLEAN